MYFLFIWIRGTLPRVRIDQLLAINWKFLVPFTLVLLLFTAVLDKLIPATMGAWGRTGIHLAMNLALATATMQILSSYARRQRAAQEAGRTGPGAPRPVAAVMDTHADAQTMPAH